MSKWLIVISAFVMIAAGSSYGYIDLGSGSYIIQVLLAGLLAALYGLKGWISKLFKTLLFLIKKEKHSE